jgi:hypothetical protein
MLECMLYTGIRMRMQLRTDNIKHSVACCLIQLHLLLLEARVVTAL